MKDLIHFENTYKQNFSQYLSPEDDALASVTIDSYPEQEDKEGSVVAVVWLTKHGDIIVDWHDNAYRMDVVVLDLIKESREYLKKEFSALNGVTEDTLQVQVTWNFDVDVSDFDPESVDVRGLAIDLTQRELADLLEKKELSAEDFYYKIVEKKTTDEKVEGDKERVAVS